MTTFPKLGTPVKPRSYRSTPEFNVERDRDFFLLFE
jgi:hypothetical protein